MTLEALLVAPHADDIAYSLGGHLAAGLFPGPATALATVFSTSAFAPYDTSTSNTIEAISALRRREDEAFVKLYNLRLESLGLEEAPVRLGLSDPSDVFVDVCDNAEYTNNPEVWRIVDRLSQLATTDTRVYVPLGIGGHLDHLLVRAAAHMAFAPNQLFFYEDVPYAGEIPFADYRRQCCVLAEGLESSTLPSGHWLGRKIAGLSIYTSQVSSKDLASVRQAAIRADGERTWKTSSWPRHYEHRSHHLLRQSSRAALPEHHECYATVDGHTHQAFDLFGIARIPHEP